ncbi:MAG TPA: ABC transporter ATP-binding protein [Acidimicrobiales bacterium]|nr:ABC transporter ATP-binding protein [Acidimicrobiales bacterium]
MPATTYASRAVDAVKVYGSGSTEVTALDGLSVDFEHGVFSALMGPSGSGKSTLLHCLAGLDRLTSGQALLDEVDLTTLEERRLTEMRRDKVGFIFQGFNLIPTLTALENITLPSKLARREYDGAWLDKIVDTVGLRARLSHRPTELSGGEQQRVAAARALLGRPAVIFADEPTGNLDTRTGAALLSFLRDAVADLGQTIVMVTHDPIAASYAGRVVFMADGHVVDELQKPTAEKVIDKMRTLDVAKA